MTTDYIAAGAAAGSSRNASLKKAHLPYSDETTALVEETLVLPALPSERGEDDIWAHVRIKLRERLGEQVFTSWFASMEFDGINGGIVRLSVPTRFLKQWILSNYRDKVLAIWEEETMEARSLDITIRGASRCMVPPAATEQPLQGLQRGTQGGNGQTAKGDNIVSLSFSSRETNDGLGSPLDKRFTFANFFAGRSNSLAFAAAQQVASAKQNDPISFNPLVIHSSVGQGKTHLLQAVAHEARSAGRQVVYLTAERFMYGFVAAIKAQSAIAFKENLRGIHLLLIDDLQFLQGKHVQAEFGHTLNALLDGSRQVVVAADRAPSDLESLDERMRSRLCGGLTVELGAPEEEVRCNILKAKAELLRDRYPNFTLPEGVVAYVAHAVTSNGRDLDGALNRLVAHNQLTHSALTVDMAEEVIRDLIRHREPKRVKIEEIQRIVAKHYNVQRQDLLSNRRTHNVVMPRQIAMYLAKSLTPRSLPEIGRRFGGRDHTTVLHAVRKIEDLNKPNTQLNQDIELLRRLLLET
ncbi:MAG: chromosomal replication initiator protein DnaA [Pseudomonadota bacterium]